MENSNEEKEQSFEQALEKLEEIVQKLEQGDVPLEEAIESYKEGMQLSKVCNNKLQKVETEITEIMKDNGQVEAYNLEEE
ncbi:exodeoxyribonuclease VII small subunit [Halalkalibacillus halophilus]|uniref:exodeoxyribonuclease VII small subunit n=1 Tax=Halalkalibacillus halophilus TaxID=392827 RepID=UPI000486C203|nr:exodeoxyribonuclease VII small subunit [Halalkalibacillus halophilus]